MSEKVYRSLHFPFRQLKMLTSTEVKTLVSLYELVCHLVHLNEQFLSQFCDSVEILGATDLLVGFISQGKYGSFLYGNKTNRPRRLNRTFRNYS